MARTMAGMPIRRMRVRTISTAHTVTTMNEMPVEYSYMLPSGQCPASNARVKIEAACSGQPSSTSASAVSPSHRRRSARKSTNPTRARLYAPTAAPKRTRDAEVLAMGHRRV